jgi:hypothetical protein
MSSKSNFFRITSAMFYVLITATLGFCDESLTLSDEVIPYDPGKLVERPNALLELGGDYLGTGPIGSSFELPGGAIWQPSLLVFGTMRSAVQSLNNGVQTNSEWANRLDLFANLQLSGTERIVVGIRPLDEESASSGYQFEPSDSDGWLNAFDDQIETLFFEGDFGELLPFLDPYDFSVLDVGFSVGRQGLLVQDGLLIDDNRIDGVGITKNTIRLPGVTNLLVTGFFGWNEIHRDDNLEDSSAKLYAIFSEADTYNHTLNLDLIYVDAESETGDGIYGGLSTIQRIGKLNTSFRVMGSHSLDEETTQVSDGVLLFSEFSFTPTGTEDIAYADLFWGIQEFASAARGVQSGGPLGRTGILFASVRLGRYVAPISNRADDAAGFAAGYQLFSKDMRKQVIFEIGGRQNTEGRAQGVLGFGSRGQIAVGRHLLFILDGFVAVQEAKDPSYGGRLEFQVKT